MKKFLTLALLSAVSAICFAQQEEKQYLPHWEEGYMDIHSIATGKGESSFLIFPDGTTMLIDAGDATGSFFVSQALPNASLRPAEWIVKYIATHSVNLAHPDVIDHLLVTHFHGDHIGCRQASRPGKHYALCGVMEVGEKIRFNHIVDRGYPKYDFPDANVLGNMAGGIISDYKKFIASQSQYAVIEQFKVGSDSQFNLKNTPEGYNDFKIFNIAANGEVSDGSRTFKMYTDNPKLLDENMLSCAIRLEYGPFSYFTGGDITGSMWGDHEHKATNRDFETFLADICGPTVAIKANHHGWSDSSNPYFMWKVRPDVVVITSNHQNHPMPETIDRLSDPHYPGKHQMFVTSDAARQRLGEERWAKLPPYGHIVIRVYNDGTYYQVFVLDVEDYHIKYKTDKFKTR